MPNPGAEQNSRDAGRKETLNPGAAAGYQVRKRILAWWKLETAEEKAIREAKEAKEAREDFVAEFWNGLPDSERIRLMSEGGCIYEGIMRLRRPTLPKEHVRRSTMLGL